MTSDGTAPPNPPRFSGRRWALILITAAIALVVLLAITIAGVQLLPGEPLLLRLNPLRPGAPAPGMPGADFIVGLVRILLALSILLFPVYIIYAIFSRDGRRRLLLNIISMAILFVTLSSMRNLALNLDLAPMQGDLDLQAPTQPEQTPPEAVFNADPPEWAVLAVTLGVSLLLVALGAAAIAYVIRRRRAPSPMRQLASEAQQAIDALQAGGELEETITRCYHDMCRVVQNRRGLQREAAMTPAEFEGALRANGLPREAVGQLTHLFEEVRYGARQAGERERRQAIDSLTTIVAACGGPA